METLYTNGTILTMEDDCKSVEAIVIKDDKIAALGNKQDLMKSYPNATIVDLGNRVLLPSLIDAHSHFTGLANSLRLCDLTNVHSYDELVACMQAFKENRHLSDSDWIIGSNYDHNFMKEKKHPDRRVLDRISVINPIYISHASSHMGVANTKAMEVLHIPMDVQDPKGGKYGRFESGEANGYMEESAFMAFQQKVPMPNIDSMLDLYKQAQMLYASYGITTIQEGFTPSSLFSLLQKAAQDHVLTLDVVAYLDAKEDAVKKYPNYQQYHQHLRIGGYKTFLDGSPQGRTAWMQEPYLDSVDYCGYPSLSDDELDHVIQQCIDEKQQLLVHCNGDAAAKQYVDAVERVNVKNEEHLHRPVMIHAQFVKEEELKRMKALEMIPSFFVAHTWYWGDIHIQNFGMERANRMSAVQWAKQNGLTYTFHNDSPVIPPNLFFSCWCAVHRETKNHVQLSKEQAVSIYDALKAVTIHAAKQYGEENEKGSLKEGKRADYIIVDQNPLNLADARECNLHVCQTFKDGRCIFEKD